ncbi:GntR family transcriptional regulator [Alkalihalobacillus sp. AL-G]|uniref:GntR family transcriptional regulator n=1 Tax=Alkalihalobacillus sp. AL-G TaxID=2926399 RepID=UPI002729CA5B|nr:GntR family transcriptional regulator [Alkalihalobacillus sp. AL-G]WLD94537.1 GntR family transcriptional regulator [Alkalihalobacillus sp. AL-G]
MIITTKQIKYQTLQAQAYDYIYNKIVSGEIPPGQKVVEQKIVTETGISRSPIREAIRQLTSEGLVTVHPHGGVRVYRATSSDYKYLFECRLSLEPTAAYYAAIRINTSQRFELDQLMKEMNQAAKMKDIHSLKLLSNRFHNMILETSGNPYLVKMMKQLYSLITFYRNVILNMPQRIEMGVVEHQEIWKAIRDRDGKTAEKLMKEHLKSDYNHYISEYQSSD